jgi:hypothetical protein
MATTVNTDQLLEWFQDPSNRAYFNSDLLVVKKSPISSGVGVFAKKTQNHIPNEDDIEENNLLLRVHKSMVLSAQTCTISNLLYEHGLSGMYGLVLAFIYEKELGELSPWYVYLNSINYKDNKDNLILPLCLLSEKDKSILKGTEIEFMGGLDDEDIKNHFKISRQFANDIFNESRIKIPLVLLSDDKFNEFAAITMAIASRAFEIDNYIELGLVPGADLFNHEPYGQENVHFVTLGDVCPFCGKDNDCWHEDLGPPDSEDDEDDDMKDDEDDEDDENEEGEEDEEDEEIEELDEITMDYVKKIEKEFKEKEEKEKEESNNADDDSDDEFDHREFYLNPDECCDIVLETKIVKNKEVYNTYGELPNSVLLVKYGFAVEDNPYDTICLGPQIVNFRKNHPELEKRFDWWSCMGWLLLKEEEKHEKAIEEDDEDRQSEDGNESDDGESMLDNPSEADEDDEDDDQSYLLNCRIDYPGEANNQLLAVSKLFTIPTEQFEKMIGDEDCDGELIMNELVKTKPSIESKKLLKQWIDERYAVTGDGKSKASELKRNLRKTDPQSSRYHFTVTVMNEKKMLEKALKNLKI